MAFVFQLQHKLISYIWFDLEIERMFSVDSEIKIENRRKREITSS